jgi:hypothetical protein
MAWSLSTLAGLAVFAVVLSRQRLHDPAIPIAGIGTPIAVGAPATAKGTLAVPPEPDRADPLPPAGTAVGGARHLGPIRPSAGRPALRFDAPPGPGVERRTVSYRQVRVGDGPDGVRSAEVGRLERGDEVEVIEWRDGTALVRNPDGLQGWIHSATIIGGRVEPLPDD